MLHLLRDRCPLLILPLQPTSQKKHQYNVPDKVCQRHRVSYHEPRSVVGSVQLRAHDSTQVADADLHRVRRRALRLTRDVNCRPRKYQRRRGINARSGEEGAQVWYAWSRCRVCVRKQDDVAYGSDGGGARDKDGAAMQLLRVDGDCQRRNEGECVRRNGEQLRHGSGVSEVLDDGGEEKRQRVERQTHGVEAEAIQPARGVSRSVEDCTPGEGLVV